MPTLLVILGLQTRYSSSTAIISSCKKRLREGKGTTHYHSHYEREGNEKSKKMQILCFLARHDGYIWVYVLMNFWVAAHDYIFRIDIDVVIGFVLFYSCVVLYNFLTHRYINIYMGVDFYFLFTPSQLHLVVR